MSNKRFSLVYEPRYSSSQYVIQFKKTDVKNYEYNPIEVEKYRGIPNCKKGKNTLEEIDLLTTCFENESYFLSNVGIHKPIHSLFIALPKKGYINKISPVFGNSELKEKLVLVKDGKVKDKKQVEEFIYMLLENDKAFYNFFLKYECYKSLTLKQIISNLRNYSDMLKSWPDHETNCLYGETKTKLKEEIEKYHVYRELLLAKQAFIKQQETKQKEKIIVKDENNISVEFKPLEAEEQLIFPGFPKIIKK